MEVEAQTMVGEAHPLHKVIGGILLRTVQEQNSCDLVLDEACGVVGKRPRQHIPLFATLSETPEQNVSEATEPSQRLRYCDVDALILDKGVEATPKIIVVIEIEETGISPSRMCGKFLTSALSSYYSHSDAEDGRKRKSATMGDKVLFVQVIDKTMAMRKEDSRILAKLDRLFAGIRTLAEKDVLKVKEYCLICGTVEDFKDEKGKLLKSVIIKWIDGKFNEVRSLCQPCL